MPSTELSRAVVVYVGRGLAAPHVSRERVILAFGEKGSRLADDAENLVAETDGLVVDWSVETLQSATHRVRAVMAERQPELSDEALDALAWRWSFDWR